jgi:DNA-binding response OmpR family regulator
MKFFIVDDEPDVAEMYAEAVKFCGHSVLGIAYNGVEAVEKYAGFLEPPDAVILDHRMPMKSGMEVCREMLGINPRAMIIMASADESIEKEARALNVASFKKKPFTIDRLINNIEKLESRLARQ